MRFLKNIFLYFFIFLFINCSGDDEAADDFPLNDHSEFEMKVDEQLWKADYSFIQSNYAIDSDEDTFLITIMAMKYKDDEEEEIAERIQILLSLKQDKFNDPRGTYPIIMTEQLNNSAVATYDIFDSQTYYGSFNPEDPDNEEVGSISIEEYEIGEQLFLGDGYIYLKGKFALDMYSSNDNGTVNKIEITVGNFKINNDLFDF